MTKEILPILSKAKSWSDIHENLEILNNKNTKLAGTLFEHFCKYYFLEEPSISEDYKNIWLFDETPLVIKTRLGLTKTDYGVDLVLEDKENKLYVVQCKFRNNQDSKLSWTKDKIANLFAEGDKADYFVVFTNASGLDKHSKHKKEDKFRLFTVGDLLEIQPETIKAMVSMIEGKKTSAIPKVEPRDYQLQAINDVVKGFQTNDRGQFILPCGAGKTLTALWIKEKLRPKNTLVLVPSLALLRQTKNQWHKHQQKWVPYLCVCSEKDIDKNSNKDLPVVHTYEIGGNVTTNAEEIRDFLLSHPKTIIYSTYQSLEAIKDAIQKSGFSFDLAICDEAHKTAGSKKSVFGLIHDQTKIPVQKRLYMTATPRIISAQAKGKLDEDKLEYLADMSDPEVYGPELHRMSFKDAIDKKILVDYQILAVGVSDKELQEAIMERKFIDDYTTIEEIANNYALEKTMKKHKANHAITFHSSIKKAENFKEKHKTLYPGILSDHVSGKLTTNDRKIILDEFEKSPRAVITNARCLTEGVDVPAIDLVYFCDPKNSKIDIVQAAGRALRRADHKGKKFGYIVVPIFHEAEEKLEETIETSAFKNLISVIRALCDQDERLQAEITKVKIGEGKRKPASSSAHIKIIDEVPLIILEGFENKLKETLFSNVIDKTPIPWRSFVEARKFVITLGLKNWEEWNRYCKGKLLKKGKKPNDIPSNPDKNYKNQGWISMGDWLGTGKVAYRLYKFCPFKEARKFVQNLKLKSSTEWRKYCKGVFHEKGVKPNYIPSNPHKEYANHGWINMGDWLGTGMIAQRLRKYRPFEEARKFVQNLKLKSGTEWRKYCKGVLLRKYKKPDNIPADPRRVYKNHNWVNMGDWLGTGRIADQLRNYRSFEKARKFVQDLKLKNNQEWRKYCKGELTEKEMKPVDIPTCPDKSYRNKGWTNWGDWLGTGIIAPRLREYRPFEEARKFVRNLQLKSHMEWWKEYCKGKLIEKGIKPDDIPANPSQIYKDKGWISWKDWLGKK